MRYGRTHRRRPVKESEQDIGVPLGSPLIRRVEALNRTFDFSPLALVLPTPLATKVAKTLCAYFQRFARKTAVGRFQEFMAFGKWLSKDQSVSQRFMAESTTKEIWPNQLWIQSLNRWSDVLRKRHGTHYTTLAECFGNLYLCLDALAHAGIVPHTSKPALPRNYHMVGKRRPSLSELQGISEAANNVLTDVQKEVLKRVGDAESDEARRYAALLASIIPRELAHDEVSFAEALQRHNRQLLDSIRRVSEETFIHWQEQYRLGQQLIAAAEEESADWLTQVFQAKTEHFGELLNRWFPTSDEQRARGRFLRALATLYGDQVPSESKVANPSRYRHLVRRFGGRHSLDGMLTAHINAVAAAMFLYLCDSGANVSSALELRIDFEEPTDDPSLVRVCTTKPRAGYPPIIDTLPVRDLTVQVTAVEALRAIREMTAHRRQIYGHLGDTLFVYTYFNEPSAANGDFVANRLRYFMRDSEVPGKYLPSSIRQSVVLDVAMRNDGNLRTVNAFTHHQGSKGVTERYARAWPIRLILTRRIREFQTLLEASLVFGIEDGFQRLGVSPEVGAHLYERAVRTGLGLSCSSQGSSAGTGEGTNSCDHLGDCPMCERRLFLVDEANLAEILALHKILTDRQVEMESEQPVKWEKTWIPLLAYATVVIDIVKNSHYARYLKPARKMAERLLAQGYDPTLLRLS